MVNDHFKTTSYLATLQSAILFGVLSFASLYGGFEVLGGFLMFAALLSGWAYGWGKLSVSELTVALHAQSYRVYPGETVEMDFALSNGKSLPLLWLEWIQMAPPNQCLVPPEEFTLCQMTADTAEEGTVDVLCKGFSFIKWYATITWHSQFYAAHRGVYHPKSIIIHTGDGFGLGVKTRTCPLETPPVFVVYPKRVAVKTEVFFKNTWSASTGPQGTIEDVSVLRGIRPYQPHDSAKRINWRLMARGGEISVNVYDHIAPNLVCFFIDTATFAGVSEDNEAFEETLSVVASIIEELFAQGLSVGLYLSQTGQGLNVDVEQSNLQDCLLALALCDCNNPEACFGQQGIAALLSGQAGSIYYVCHNAKTGGFATLFEGVGISRFSVIGYEDPGQLDGVNGAEIKVYQVSEFQKG